MGTESSLDHARVFSVVKRLSFMCALARHSAPAGSGLAAPVKAMSDYLFPDEAGTPEGMSAPRPAVDPTPAADPEPPAPEVNIRRVAELCIERGQFGHDDPKIGAVISEILHRRNIERKAEELRSGPRVVTARPWRR